MIINQKPNYDFSHPVFRKRPLYVRYAKEHIAISEMNSDVIKVEVKDTVSPLNIPKVYEVHYKVKSISHIDEHQQPVYSHQHTLRITLPPRYPLEPCIIYMLTDTWHPNIRSSGAYKGRICGNVKNFGRTYTVNQLILRIGEILQYKNYHAELTDPYPEDMEVAEWVRTFAEPNKIVQNSEGIVIDKTPLVIDNQNIENNDLNKKIESEVAVKNKIQLKKKTENASSEKRGFNALFKIKKLFCLILLCTLAFQANVWSQRGSSSGGMALEYLKLPFEYKNLMGFPVSGKLRVKYKYKPQNKKEVYLQPGKKEIIFEEVPGTISVVFDKIDYKSDKHNEQFQLVILKEWMKNNNTHLKKLSGTKDLIATNNSPLSARMIHYKAKANSEFFLTLKFAIVPRNVPRDKWENYKVGEVKLPYFIKGICSKWDIIKNRKLEDWVNYYRNYSNSDCRTEASALIREADENYWTAIRYSTDKADFHAYLRLCEAYKDIRHFGKYRDLASAKTGVSPTPIENDNEELTERGTITIEEDGPSVRELEKRAIRKARKAAKDEDLLDDEKRQYYLNYLAVEEFKRYVEEAEDGVARFSELEWIVEDNVDGFGKVVSLKNTKNPTWKDLSEFEGMHVDDSHLEDQHELKINFDRPGNYSLFITDEWGKNGELPFEIHEELMVEIQPVDTAIHFVIANGTPPFEVILKDTTQQKVWAKKMKTSEFYILFSEWQKAEIPEQFSLMVKDANKVIFKDKTVYQLPTPPSSPGFFVLLWIMGSLATAAVGFLIFLFIKRKKKEGYFE